MHRGTPREAPKYCVALVILGKPKPQKSLCTPIHSYVSPSNPIKFKNLKISSLGIPRQCIVTLIQSRRTGILFGSSDIRGSGFKV